jgi:hypothetical protein
MQPFDRRRTQPYPHPESAPDFRVPKEMDWRESVRADGAKS